MGKTYISPVAQYAIIFYYKRIIKWTFFPRSEKTNPFNDCLVEKNRVRHGENIYFLVPQYTMVFYYGRVIKWTLFPRAWKRGNKVHFITS